MSWLRTAVNKVVEAGNKNNLTRAVKSYADSVVYQARQAVAEGAKLLQDCIGARSFKSFKQTVKRLEEASISCRGPERIQLMGRWLIALKEIEILFGGPLEDKEKTLEQHHSSEELKDNMKTPSIKEEALKFRVTKASEVGEIEKELTAEVADLEKQRDELEAALKKVNISLAAANACLHNIREERDQFYDVNDQIVTRLKTKEDELSRSVGSYTLEADVLRTWINFLEDTWVLQSSNTKTKEKEVRKENSRVKELFDNIEKLRDEFEAIERPILELETPPKAVETLNIETETPSSVKKEESPSNPALHAAEIPDAKKNKLPESPSVKPEQVLDAEAELAKFESEFGKVNPDYCAEEIGGWEFNELESDIWRLNDQQIDQKSNIKYLTMYPIPIHQSPVCLC